MLRDNSCKFKSGSIQKRKHWRQKFVPKMVGNTMGEAMADYYPPENQFYNQNSYDNNYYPNNMENYNNYQYDTSKDYNTDYTDYYGYSGTQPPPPYVMQQCHYENYTSYEGEYYGNSVSVGWWAGQSTEVKHAGRMMRVNLKQQLMRQQIQDQQKHHNILIPASVAQHNITKAVEISGSSVPSEVPPAIYKVKTGLANPTKYHVEMKQKSQVEEYLTHDRTTSQSLPAAIAAANNSLNVPLLGTGSSAPVDPESPLSLGMCSTATSVSETDDFDLLDGIINLEAVDPHVDADLSLLEATPQLAHTMPHNGHFMDHMYELNTAATAMHQKSSSSCPAEIDDSEHRHHHGGRQRQGTPPPFLNSDETHMWMKERVKKDNHNVIEKRRRLNINDRIKELGTLLPKNLDPHLYSDMRQNKGTILRASVDYIRKLKRDQDRIKLMQERERQLELTNRKMLLKMQEMEMLMQAHGIQSNAQESPSAQLLSDVLRTSSNPNNSFLKPEPNPNTVSDDVIMDDPSPIHSDPMMSHSSPVIHHSTVTGNVSMEEISDMLS